MPLKKIPPGISPGGGELVSSSLGSKTPGDLQAMIQSAILGAMQPLVSEVRSLNSKVENFQQFMLNMQQKTQQLEMAAEETKQKVTKVECKTSSINKKQAVLEHQLISVQLDRAKTTLRFQDIPESKGDLKEQMSNWLAPLVKMSKEDFKGKIHEVYRVSSNFIKKNNLPREVHLRMTDKQLRDDILKKANEQQLTFGDIKIKTLKDIPFLVRQRRRMYKNLTKLLIQNKIPYVWCFPEGLRFVYKTQNIKLTSEEKLKDFMKRHGGSWEHRVFLFQMMLRTQREKRPVKMFQRWRKKSKINLGLLWLSSQKSRVRSSTT